MNINGHLKKANEIKRSLNKLLPDPKGENVIAVVELIYGVLIHLIAFGMEKRYQRHIDTHVGLPKELRKVGENEIAEIFEEIDTFRAGRWYGAKGNGEIVKRSLNCLEKVEIWAREK